MLFTKRFTLVLAALVLLVAGCARQEVDAQVAEVVSAYARNLPPVLGAESLDSIRPYATPAQVDRMRLYVVMVTEERREMIRARLLAQKAVSTEVSGDSATVVSSEEWSIVYTDRDTGEELRRGDYTADVEYRLVRVEGRWYVDEVISE